MHPIRYPLAVPLAAAAFGAAVLCAPAIAQENDRQPRITVTGEGRATVTPDMAVLTLTVTREADTARDALNANTEAMGSVLSAMKEEGIKDRDLQTSNFSIEPKYVYPNRSSASENKPPRIEGYVVRNTLTVRVRNLDKVGAIIDTSVTLGVNEGGNVTFTNEDPSMALAEARADAMRDAVARAGTLTGAADIGLGKILEIAENSGGRPPMPIARAQAFAAEASAVPIAAGENAYTVTVTVTFALEQ